MNDESQTRPTLIESVKDKRNAAAWEKFVKLYQPRLRNWALGMGFSDTDADDAAAEILAKLVQHIDKFEYDTNRTFRGYLRRMLQTWASDEYHRRNRLGTIFEVREDDENQWSDKKELLLDELCANEDKALKIMAVHKVLGQIDESDRSLWIAMQSKSIPIKDILQEFEISTSAAYRRKDRISKMMSQQLVVWKGKN